MGPASASMLHTAAHTGLLTLQYPCGPYTLEYGCLPNAHLPSHVCTAPAGSRESQSSGARYGYCATAGLSTAHTPTHLVWRHVLGDQRPAHTNGRGSGWRARGRGDATELVGALAVTVADGEVVVTNAAASAVDVGPHRPIEVSLVGTCSMLNEEDHCVNGMKTGGYRGAVNTSPN